MSASVAVGFEPFKASWLESITAGSPSTRELGKRFALKLITQWMDTSELSTDFVFCDGSGDGGIDVAILDTGTGASSDEADESGHSWYLVQSKYGKAFSGTTTLLSEGQKVIDTLDGKHQNLSSLAEGLLERLRNFRNTSSAADKIVLVFATVDALSESERVTLSDLRAMGKARLGPLFDVEAISVQTIYTRLEEDEATRVSERLNVHLNAQVVPSGADLLVGSISLVQIYNFLKTYREATGDLDRIYEKNVRRFLGGRGKVNKAMQATLRDAPERFGLYNNGITIVVHEYQMLEEGISLTEPYIVNGCQTTRTIWDVFHQRYGSGGTGSNPEIEAWKTKAASGVVVAKIVKVGAYGDNLLQAITRYTNSQNAVREKDFLALTSDFRTWQNELSEHYDLYLEIQRGGWDSQKALQNTNPQTKQFIKNANAADLVKVYGAGWLGEAGTAFGKNPPFLPDGSIFKRIVNGSEDDGGPFGYLDLFAAYLLQQATNELGFGRGALKLSRRQTRFLFYMVVIELFKDVLSRASMPSDLRTTSRFLIIVLQNEQSKSVLLDQACEVIDTYFTQGTEDTVYVEPAFINSFNGDLNGFLKWEKLGRPDTETPVLKSVLAINKAVLGRPSGGNPSPRQVITNVLSEAQAL